MSKTFGFKLKDKWVDKYSNIKNFLYENNENLRIVHSINPNTIEFDISIIVRAGSYYEPQINVPQGTAHFLEHIISDNPNKVFTTKQELKEYAYGNKKRASFDYNASTSKQFMYFYCHGNSNATMRMVKFLHAQLDFPYEKTKEYIEHERKIIQSEYSRRLKAERDPNFLLNQLIYGKEYPEYCLDNLGTETSINKIQEADLIKFKNETFKKENVIISIQSNKSINPSIWRELKKFANLFSSEPSTIKKSNKPLSIDFKSGHFYDNDRKNIFMSLSYITKATKKLESDEDYREDRLYALTKSLNSKLLFEYLREQRGLVYSVEAFSYRLLFDYANRGITTQFEKENFLEVLNGLDYIYEEFSKEFLVSNAGKIWFESMISFYLYKNNSEFNENYAEGIGIDVIDDENDKYDYIRARRVVMNITPKDLLNFYTSFIKIKPTAWFVSPYEEKEVFDVFKSSKLFKRYSS